MAFYEPLNEQLAGLRATSLPELRADHWYSRHRLADPYFAEYAPQLSPGHAGVERYERRFALQNYFGGTETEDPALYAYLRSLLDAAGRAQRIPVLKFSRSLGRMAWLTAHFPQAEHVLVLRDPQAQFRSITTLEEAGHDPYFLANILMILARGAAIPLVGAALALFQLPLPALPHGSDPVARQLCRRFLGYVSLHDQQRYFMAFWCVTALMAARHASLVIDIDRLVDDAAYRAGTTAHFHDTLGIAPCFDTAGANSRQDLARPQPMQTRCSDHTAWLHDLARGFIAAHAQDLDPAHRAMLLGKLRPAAAAPLPPGRSVARVCAAPAFMMRRGPAWHVYLALTRLSMPLRRLHGRMVAAGLMRH